MHDNYLYEMIINYIELNAISPKNELLKYYVLYRPELFREFFILGLIAKAGRKLEHEVCYESGLERNPDEKIIQEFIDRFRGDVPTKEEAKKTNMPYKVYLTNLYAALPINYISAMKKAIELAEISN
jgi:hypothetical protein